MVVRNMKPMLAATLESLDDVKYPVYASPKLDGIRCIIHNGVAVSRKLKLIPNEYVQSQLKGLPEGLDGELVTSGTFNDVQSGIMSEDGTPDFHYHVFDKVGPEPFEIRKDNILQGWTNVRVKRVAQYYIETAKQAKFLEQKFEDMGYEGIMLRSPQGPYKFGRSTLKEGYLLKYKRFLDSEAIVIGFAERMHNGNEAEKDNLGNTKRSAKKAGKTGMNTLGALIVHKDDSVFNIGTGFDDATRQKIWDNKEWYLGLKVTYKYQEETPDGIPRFPVFKGFRLE